MSGTPTLTNKRDHADLPVKPSLVEPVHDKTPPMFQGTFHLHVLVASGFRGAADPQLPKRFSENVIVTETRVRISLAIPARRDNSCSALCTRVSLSVSRVVVFNDDMSDQLAVNQSVFSSSSLRSTVASS